MKKKPFKYYVFTFLLVFAFIAIVSIISHAKGTYFISNGMKFSNVWAKEFNIFLYKGKVFTLGNYVVDILALIVIPFFFTIFFYLIDLFTSKLERKSKREKRLEEERYSNFIDDIGKELNKLNIFNVEDFRKFRESDKFQESLKKLYDIYKNGETENNNFSNILRKYKSKPTEKEAMEYLIDFTKKRMTEKEK